MNKKFIFSMFAATTMLLATSCSSDDLAIENASGNMVTATFIVETPEGISTRAVSDGKTVDKVACAVYDENGEELKNLYKTVNMAEGKATYSINLAKGQEYRVAFFAYNNAAQAYDVTDLKNVKVNTTAQTSNNEGRDAFTAYVDVTGAETQSSVDLTVTLKRPFAQLNIATADKQAASDAGIDVKQTKVIVTDVYTTFSAFDNDVVANAETSDITFNLANIPTDPATLTAEGKDYAYLAFNYLLVGDKGVTDVTFTWADGANTNTTEYANVPVQRNYRTNIVGNLLTSNADFTIVVDQNYATPDETIGASTEVIPDDNGVYNVSKASELLWIAEQVNAGNMFAGKTVKLTNDIYLANSAWTPMGSVQSYPSTTFAGTFDGNGKTIHDLNVNKKEAAGLFGSITGVVKNLTVDGAKIVSNHWGGVICGYSSANVGMEINNCHVKNATVTLTTEQTGVDTYDNGDKAGGIIGYMVAGDVVTGCTVENTSITAYRDLGGIVGHSRGTVSDCKVLGGVTVTVDASHNYKGYPSANGETYDAGHIVGDGVGATITNCSGEATLNVPAAVAAVATAAELEAILKAASTTNGISTVNITNDIELKAGEDWKPVFLATYSGASIVINGGGHYISGLNGPLFDGGFGGTGTFTINDLTIKDSEMTDNSKVTNSLTDGGFKAMGVFIGAFDAGTGIELNNCHAVNVTIANASHVGLVGYSSSASNKFINCSATDCNFEAFGNVGGIAGLVYNSTLENCIVKNSTLANTEKGGRAEKVGSIVGTLNAGNHVMNNCKAENNTILGATSTKLYGRFAQVELGTFHLDGTSMPDGAAK